MDEDLSKLTPTQLYRKRQLLLAELGECDLDLQRRRSEKRRVVRKGELNWTDPADMSPEQAANFVRRGLRHCQLISPELGFDISNMHMFILEIAPHSEGGAYHRHGDAIKHYLSGRAVECIEDERYEMEAGDFIHIPANMWNGTQNPYDEPVRILAVQQFPGTYTQQVAPFLDKATSHSHSD